MNDSGGAVDFIRDSSAPWFIHSFIHQRLPRAPRVDPVPTALESNAGMSLTSQTVHTRAFQEIIDHLYLNV